MKRALQIVLVAREKSVLDTLVNIRKDGLPVRAGIIAVASEVWVEAIASVSESIAAIATVANAGLGLAVPLSVTTTVTTATEATIGSFNNRSSGEESHSDNELERG